MPIANTLKRYLDSSKVEYEIITHPLSGSSMETAEQARVPGYQLAKGIIFKDRQGYLMTVLPSPRHVDMSLLQDVTGRNLELLEEVEVGTLFADCDLGAVPPIGEAYNLEVLLDSALRYEEYIYFEAGDHRELIRVSGAGFIKLQKNAQCESFAR